jgi:hypothetical protein
VFDAYGNFKQQCPNGRSFYGNYDLTTHQWSMYDSFAKYHPGNKPDFMAGYAMETLGKALAGVY